MVLLEGKLVVILIKSTIKFSYVPTSILTNNTEGFELIVEFYAVY